MTDLPPASIPAPEPAPPPAPAPRSGRWILTCLVLGAAVFGGGYWYFQHYKAPPQQAQAAPPPVLPVTVSKPRVETITEWDEFTGQFEAVDSVEIRARVSGYLDKIGFEDGQMVKKGDMLFVIDPRPFEIALKSAQSSLASANARVALAKQQLGRAETLKQKDFTSQATLDQRQQEAASAAADAQVAQSAINAAQLDLDFTKIEAPLDGRIGRHEVSLGNLIMGGDGGETTLLTTIVSLDPIRLVFDMSESDYLAYQRREQEGKMASKRDSLPVEAHLMDEKEWTLKGKMDFVNNQVDRSSGTIRARAVFANPGLLITPGQFGRIRITGSEPHEAILIPDSAIVSDQSNKIVMTVDAGGKVVPKTIRPGPGYQGLRIVREGLSKDDVIIIDGLLRARAGATVKPEPGKIDFPPEPGN
ncbi:efflux RND transporter periplasmic adaptor subunit [Dongia sp.]|uniref:efflux RND transporter periplasmic adaptor subunit n=1 Tax=Dongia sp. TaxID=1977262 RepID=UPI003752F8B1